MNGTARVEALVLRGGHDTARLLCDPALIPSPGRYVRAHEAGSGALLASALFLAERASGGFIAAPPIPSAWRPGGELNMRGPLGRGFTLPPAARRVALCCIGVDAARLLPLVEMTLRQHAAVTLVCDNLPADLPLQLEVQPMQALSEVCAWSDYAAFDVERDALGDLLHRLDEFRRALTMAPAEVLARVPMPCGGSADCGVCSIRTPGGFKLACVDGPVFDLRLLLARS
jgi:NAD(P)H-flavin reductase